MNIGRPEYKRILILKISTLGNSFEKNYLFKKKFESDPKIRGADKTQTVTNFSKKSKMFDAINDQPLINSLIVTKDPSFDKSKNTCWTKFNTILFLLFILLVE